MPVLVTCPACSQKLKLPDGSTSVECTGCGQKIRLKGQQASASPPLDPWDEEDDGLDEFGEPEDFIPRARSQKKRRPKPAASTAPPAEEEPKPGSPVGLLIGVGVGILLLVAAGIGIAVAVWAGGDEPPIDAGQGRQVADAGNPTSVPDAPDGARQPPSKPQPAKPKTNPLESWTEPDPAEFKGRDGNDQNAAFADKVDDRVANADAPDAVKPDRATKPAAPDKPAPIQPPPKLAAGTKQAVIAKASGASAMISVTEGVGTAFCVDKSGLFVTCSSVVSGYKVGSLVPIVLHSGTDNEARVRARVNRIDDVNKVAILSVVGKRDDLSALDLGVTAKLQQTDTILAFGFPFGDALAANGENPAISVNVGRITSLRRSKGELKVIQIDAQVNPGNGGGPVTNEKGEVIGLVLAGIRNSGVHFVAPADSIRATLNEPIVDFEFPDSIEATKLTEARSFEAKITPSPWAKQQDFQVSLTIESDGNKRTVPMKKADEAFAASTPLLKRSTDKRLAITMSFDSGETDGYINDGTLRIKDQELRFSSLESITKQSAGFYIVRPINRRKSIVGKLIGNPLKDVSVTLPDKSVKQMDLSKARKIEFPSPVAPQEVRLVLSVRAGDGPEKTFEHTVAVVEEGFAGVNVANNDVIRRPADKGVAVRPGGNPVGPAVPAKRVQQMKRVNLPGPVEGVCYGAAGRYMFCSIPQTKQVAVIDLGIAKVVKYIQVPSSKVLIAAGMRDLVVGIPDKNIVMRYGLGTFRKELTKAVDLSRTMNSIAMGNASMGPILVSDGERYSNSARFLSLKSLAPIKLAGKTTRLSGGSSVGASADGTLWMVRGGNMYRISGDTLEASYNHYSSSYYGVPSPDGNYIHSSRGSYPLLFGNRNSSPTVTVSGYTLPALHGPMFVRYTGRDRYSRRQTGKATLHIQGSSDTVASLDAVTEFLNGGNQAQLTLSKVVALAPALGVIGLVGQNYVEVVPFDLMDILKRGGTDYLVVVSQPVTVAQVGQAYSCPIRVLSKNGRVRMKLDAGPDGMRMDNRGVLRWKPGTASKGMTTSVVITITDASEQEILHTFKIRCF